MTDNDTTERPSDDEITERAVELDAVRHRLIRDATPQKPGFGPCVELGQFEDYASDADWLVKALLVRNAELQHTASIDTDKAEAFTHLWIGGDVRTECCWQNVFVNGCKGLVALYLTADEDRVTCPVYLLLTPPARAALAAAK